MGVELWANHRIKSEVLLGSILGNKLWNLLGSPWEHDGNTLRTRKKPKNPFPESPALGPLGFPLLKRNFRPLVSSC
jgi:hypothetical protein